MGDRYSVLNVNDYVVFNEGVIMRVYFLFGMLLLSVGLLSDLAFAEKETPNTPGDSIQRVALHADETVVRLQYAFPHVFLTTTNGVTTVHLATALRQDLVGLPVLPVVPVYVLIPAGASMKGVRILDETSTELPGTYQLEWGETPIPLTEAPASWQAASPDPAVYGSDDVYPAKSWELVGVQNRRGAAVACINLYPVRYHPLSGRVVTTGKLILEVSFSPSLQSRKPTLRYRRDPVCPVERGVENPGAIDSYERKTASAFQVTGICNPWINYQYVAVTSEALMNHNDPYALTNLIAFKRSRGLTACMVSMENIRTNYSGVDDAAKLRAFITDAYNNWGTDYILLAGDTNVVPMRALCCYGYLNDNEIPSDLYFQCLDGSFNSDGDTHWGEPTDGEGGSDVDLRAEVYIGRASAETPAECANFVYKTLAYEQAPDETPWLYQALMVGEHLGLGGVSEYATASMEQIRWGSAADGYVTAGFYGKSVHSVDKLYDADCGITMTPAGFFSRIHSNRYSIINHLGRSYSNYGMMCYNSHADALTNQVGLFAYSQGCAAGNFEADCVAEHLTTSTRHGMFAVVFNSRYGWGKYNSTDGASQRINRQFWDAYFGESIVSLGALNADSHEDNLYDINGTCVRWCIYASNLLGDPHTPIRGRFHSNSLMLSPPEGLDMQGGVEGPFTPSTKTYELFNTATNLSLAWSASVSNAWLTVSATNGLLAPNEKISLVVSIHSNAARLPQGLFRDALLITNRSNGRGGTNQPISLSINSPPCITNTSVQQGGLYAAGDWNCRFDFSEPLVMGQLDATDMVLTGIVSGAHWPRAWSYTNSPPRLTISYADLPDDRYNMTLRSGYENLKDASGLILDGEALAWPIPPHRSGNKVAGGSFSVDFQLDAVQLDCSPKLIPVLPLGSTVSRAMETATIGQPGDSDSFVFSLAGTQTLTIGVTPWADLRMNVSVFDSQGNLLSNATASVEGHPVYLDLVPLKTPGSYLVMVTCATAKTGPYQLEVVLNASIEHALHDPFEPVTPLDPLMMALPAQVTRASILAWTEPDGGLDDYYSFSLPAGLKATLAIQSLKGSNLDIDIFDAAYVWITNASLSSQEGLYVAQDFQLSASTNGFVRVSGDDAKYHLFLLRNGGLSVEPNNDPSRAQPMSSQGTMLGSIDFHVLSEELEPNDDGDCRVSSNDFKVANAINDSFQLESNSVYTVRISGKISDENGADRDYFRFTAGPGDTITATADGVTLSDPFLAVFSTNLWMVAADNDSGEGLNSLIVSSNFPYAGDYCLYVSGTGTGTYTLGVAMQYRTPPPVDRTDLFQFDAVAGETISFRTFTPGQLDCQFSNNLDPSVELYDPRGVCVASNDNAHFDGRNAYCNVRPMMNGTYIVAVKPTRQTAGEYLIHMDRSPGLPLYSFATNFVFAGETESRVMLPVEISKACTHEVRVAYRVSRGTAVEGFHYRLPSGVLTFPPGCVATGIEVTLSNDTIADGSKFLEVELSSGTNAEPGFFTVERIVLIDDERPVSASFSSTAWTASELSEVVTIKVSRANGLLGDLMVGYETRPITATPQIDYISSTGLLKMAGGSNEACLTIPLCYDTILESNEQFAVWLTAIQPGQAMLVSPVMSVVTIQDYKISRSNRLHDAGFELPAGTNTLFGSGWFWSGQSGRENWASHSKGSMGGYFKGWMGYSGIEGRVEQLIPCEWGTYTYSIWLRRERGFNLDKLYLQMQWRDANGGALGTNEYLYLNEFPDDEAWHQVYMTRTCNDRRARQVRVGLYSRWNSETADPSALMFDDTEFYPGLYTGVSVLANASFVEGMPGNSWRGSSWFATPEGVANGREPWANRDAGWGGTYYGWETTQTDFLSCIAQCLYPPPDQYTFGIWMAREENFHLTSACMRLEYYDSTLTNKVQSDTVAPVIIPNDNTWRQYFVSGSCLDTNLYELRLVVEAGYRGNPTSTVGRALKMDQALFSIGVLDSDRDQIPDVWENRFFNAGTNAVAQADPDADQMSNWEEYVADLDPTNAHSCLEIQCLRGTNGYSLNFPSSTARLYTVSYTTNLVKGEWLPLTQGVVGSNGIMSIMDTNPLTSALIYRVSVRNP
jgi:hypothetical protein